MKTTRISVAAACVILMCLAIGFLCGWFISRVTDDDPEPQDNGYSMEESTSSLDWEKDLDPEVTKRLMDGISANRIEQNLRYQLQFWVILCTTI